jgi:hypothetical protein
MGFEEQDDDYTPDVIPDNLFDEELDDNWEDILQFVDPDILGDFDV